MQVGQVTDNPFFSFCNFVFLLIRFLSFLFEFFFLFSIFLHSNVIFHVSWSTSFLLFFFFSSLFVSISLLLLFLSCSYCPVLHFLLSRRLCSSSSSFLLSLSIPSSASLAWKEKKEEKQGKKERRKRKEGKKGKRKRKEGRKARKVRKERQKERKKVRERKCKEKGQTNTRNKSLLLEIFGCSWANNSKRTKEGRERKARRKERQKGNKGKTDRKKIRERKGKEKRVNRLWKTSSVFVCIFIFVCYWVKNNPTILSQKAENLVFKILKNILL